MTRPSRSGIRLLYALALACVLLLSACSGDDETSGTRLRVGVLEYGTVNWEMDVIQRRQLAAKHGIELEIVPLASENALAVALQGDRVDLIVSDWLWVAHQRTQNRDYQFVPYSLAVGAVMVNPGSGVQTLADLNGRKLGVAGGPVDKTWLLLQAYARKTANEDLAEAVEPTYAAPPMINRLLLDGELPAAINFWHYNARLSALGMKPLLTVKQMLAGLGVDTVPPLLGWVFSESWAADHRDALQGFFAASMEAKQVLVDSDEAWAPLRDKIKPESDAVFAAIRDGYRAGVLHHYGAAEIAAAGQLFDILAQQSGREVTGQADSLSPDVFWDGFRLP
ncbi:transporter substrate-binding domain-containing protein [Salinisphaera sp. T31B1]|uniref:ABC transporter substrate-binding protein n=1 Tax=Salinisphaera sp. T31B1 TaxID=727963 RepID=UPI00333EABBB